MCDCIEVFEKKFVDEQPLEGRKILKATINKMLQFKPGKLIARPVIEMLLNIEGLKKEKVFNVAYSFCPFCGVSFDSEEGKEESDV